MIGQQVWEYSHQCDHADLREMLNGPRGKEPTTDEQLNLHRDMLVRFKCTLTSRGRSVNIKSASYKVIFSPLYCLYTKLTFSPPHNTGYSNFGPFGCQ